MSSGVARIFQHGGPKRGSEATEGGGGGVWESGLPPSHGKLHFHFLAHLDTITRGSLCTGIDQFPTLFLVSFFS